MFFSRRLILILLLIKLIIHTLKVKSNLSKILPKLQEKHPDVDVELLINHYFEIAKQEVESLSKPEIAFPWGTLKLNPKAVNHKIAGFDYLEKEYFEGNPKGFRRRKLTEIQIKRNELKRLLDIHEYYKTNGKTSRHKKRNNISIKKD